MCPQLFFIETVLVNYVRIRQNITYPSSNTIGGTAKVSYIRQIGTPIDFRRFKTIVNKINKR